MLALEQYSSYKFYNLSHKDLKMSPTLCLVEEGKQVISSKDENDCLKFKHHKQKHTKPANSENLTNKLKDYWPKLVSRLVSNGRLNDFLNTQDSYTKEWLEFAVDAWVQPQNNKLKTRAILSMLTYNYLKPGATDHQQNLSTALGVVQELNVACKRLATSIVEETLELNATHKHQGKMLECYTKNLKALAMNDVLLLNSMATRMFTLSFSKEKLYKQFLRQVTCRNSKNIYGMMLANNCKEQQKIEVYTLSMYLEIIKSKSTDLFVDPIIYAFLLVEIEGKAIYDFIEAFGTKLGLLHQIQLEYTELFKVKNNENVEISTGISCIKSSKKIPTWFAIKAYELAKTDKEKAILIENCNTARSQEEYQDLLAELGVIDAYFEYKQELLAEIEEGIDALDSSIPKEPFLYIFDLVLNNEDVDNITLV